MKRSFTVLHGAMLKSLKLPRTSGCRARRLGRHHSNICSAAGVLQWLLKEFRFLVLPATRGSQARPSKALFYLWMLGRNMSAHGAASTSLNVRQVESTSPPKSVRPKKCVPEADCCQHKFFSISYQFALE